jgi:hypothetical protein
VQNEVAVSSCSDARFPELEIAARELAVRWPIRTRTLRMLALSSQADPPLTGQHFYSEDKCIAFPKH